MSKEEYKAAILWHEMWIKGPLVGVAEYKGERVIYSRNKEGKYEIRKFKDGGYKKAERHHLAYRASNGGHRDHNPDVFTPAKINNNAIIVKTFDYIGNGIDEVIDVLEEKDFKWFHPPKRHTSDTFKKAPEFDPNKAIGTDMQDDNEDSDDDDSDEEKV